MEDGSREALQDGLEFAFEKVEQDEDQRDPVPSQSSRVSVFQPKGAFRKKRRETHVCILLCWTGLAP